MTQEQKIIAVATIDAGSHAFPHEMFKWRLWPSSSPSPTSPRGTRVHTAIYRTEPFVDTSSMPHLPLGGDEADMTGPSTNMRFTKRATGTQEINTRVVHATAGYCRSRHARRACHVGAITRQDFVWIYANARRLHLHQGTFRVFRDGSCWEKAM